MRGRRSLSVATQHLKITVILTDGRPLIARTCCLSAERRENGEGGVGDQWSATCCCSKHLPSLRLYLSRTTACLRRAIRPADASDASMYQIIDSVSIYRIISPAEISKFSIDRYRLFDILSYCRIFTCGQEVVKFSLKLSLSVKVSIKISRLLDHTWKKSAKESLNFSLWENSVKFYITTYLSEFLKQ